MVAVVATGSLVDTPLLFSAVGRQWANLLQRDRRALCTLGYLPPEVADKTWRDLSAHESDRIVFAFRLAVELGAECATALIEDSKRTA